MKFVCDKCGAQYKIKDEKIGPNGVSVRCKKCDHKIIVRLPKKAPAKAQEFPEFPSDGGAALSPDLEATRQLANPLLDLQAAEEAEKKKKAEEESKRARAAASAADEWGSLSDAASGSQSTGDFSVPSFSTEFDLGAAAASSPSDSPFDAFSPPPGDGTSGADQSGVGDGNATRVVNLAAMASLMKAPEHSSDGDDSASDGGGSFAALSSSKSAAPAPAAPPEVEWFVAIDGQQRGPMGFADVREHWERGELSESSLVWNANMADWAALGTVPELIGKLPPRASAAPTPSASGAPQAASSGAMDEWGLPKAAAQAGTSPSGAVSSAPAPVSAAPQQAPAWTPGAASMLNSLLQDEMSALGAPASPAAIPAPPPSHIPEAALRAPAAGASPSLAPLPAPSTLPAPASPALEVPAVTLTPPAPASSAFPAAADAPGIPPAPMGQDPNAPLPGIGAVDSAGGAVRDSTVPGGYSPEADLAEGNSGTGFDSWKMTAADVPPPRAPLVGASHQSRRAARSKQGGGRRQGGGSSEGRGQRDMQLTVNQELPQMPSRMSSTIKGAIGLCVAVLLIVASLAILKVFSPETLDAVVSQAPVPPAAPLVSPLAQQPNLPLAAASQDQPAAAQPSESPTAPQAVQPATDASAAAPAAKMASAASTPEEPAAAPAHAQEPKFVPASDKKPSLKKPAKRRTHVKKKNKKAPSKVAQAAAQAEDDEEEEEDEEEGDDEEESTPAPVAQAKSAPEPQEPPPPPPPPAKPEPASKVDDDFERLFGGGSSSSASAAPAAQASPASAQAKKPTVYVPPPTGAASKVSLNQSDIMSEVIKHKGAIKRCTDEEDDNGTIVMVWVIQKTGVPTGIKTATSDYAGSDLEKCLKGVIGNMKFPPYSGDQMQPIKFPFKF